MPSAPGNASKDWGTPAGKPLSFVLASAVSQKVCSHQLGVSCPTADAVAQSQGCLAATPKLPSAFPWLHLCFLYSSLVQISSHCPALFPPLQTAHPCLPFPLWPHSPLQFLTWHHGNVPWAAGSSSKCCRNCLQAPAVPRAAPLPEAPQAREAHLGCCVCLWGSLFWAMRRSCRGSAGLTGWALGLAGEAEAPGLLELLQRRPRAPPATAPRVVSENPRTSQAGKHLGDHQVQPVP